MTTPTPQQPETNITADQGFARMVDVMRHWAPARLYQAAQSTRGIRALSRRHGR